MVTAGSSRTCHMLLGVMSNSSESESSTFLPCDSSASAVHFPNLIINESDLPDPEQVEQALSQFDYFGGDELLDGAMADCTRALQLPSVVSDPDQIVRWRILKATALYLLFERDGRDDSLEGSKGTLESLIQTLGLGSSMNVSALYGLGRVYEAHNDHYCSLESQEKACQCYRKALAVATDKAVYPTRLLDEIGVHLGRVIANQATSEEVDLAVAISLLSDATERVTDTQPLKAYALAYLGVAYYMRWRSSARDNKEDLVTADAFIRRALSLTSHLRHMSRFLTILAVVRLADGTPEAFREGFRLTKQAMALLPSIPPIQNADRTVINTLANAYYLRFILEGNLTDIDEAIKCQRILSPSFKNEANSIPCIDDLCMFLCVRFDVLGHLVDIDDAIEASHRLLDLRSAGKSADLAHYSTGLAHALRFGATGEDEDFEAAQLHLETALRNVPAKRLLGHILVTLAILYNLQFELSGQPCDMDWLVVHGRQGVILMKTIQPISTDLPRFCSEHGEHLLRRFELQRDYQDLADAVAMQEDALRLASSTCNERHLLLWRYGQALRVRFEAFRDPPDSERCQHVLQDALDRAISTQLPRQSIYSAEMATLYSARYTSYSHSKDLKLSLDYYIKAAETSEGLTVHRFRAAVMGARLARDCNRNGESVRLFSAAVSLLPRLAWLGLNASKRQSKLVQTAAQLACDAAAVAIAAQLLERAVELLDEGRSVMWRSVLELRADMSALKAVAPGLAHELILVAQSLEHDDMGGSTGSDKYAEQRAARRRRTAERWEELIKDVRALKGLESFLQPLDFSTLRQAARHGPIILLNVSEYGSHALIVSLSEPVRIIPLPGIDLGTVRRLAYVLAHALHVARDQLGCHNLEGVILDICRQLWDGGIGAVAAALSDWQAQPRDRPLHVWWIPTGFLSLLPIHCAGPYKPGHPGIPDLFISSYSTTLSALLRARQTRDLKQELHGSAPRVLAIGLPETPGLPVLPYAREEMDLLAINTALSKYCSFLYGPSATTVAVTAALPDYDWIHASCHGYFDPIHPLKSAFNLMDGPLTLACIVQMRLKNADFAFLSACHTARQTAFVPDESLHLAAGLQIAGFRGVVGTAWSMVDRDGPQLADRFYHWLTVSDRAPDAKNAAESLHLAIKDLRGRGVPLYRWAAFVHYGI